MINLKLSTPTGVSIEEEVSQVEIKMVEGNATILSDHIPFISLIKNGYVKYNQEQIDVQKGIVHFDKNNMYITYFE
ncbi:MAG: hypothetical protein ACK5HR_06415 [Mycoplasmatales bacterium]